MVVRWAKAATCDMHPVKVYAGAATQVLLGRSDFTNAPTFRLPHCNNCLYVSFKLTAEGKPMTKQHNATLDGLRGVAAAAVCISHTNIALGQTPRFHGNLAVSFFFILSGFVIARAYEAKLALGLPMRRFLTIRIIRLYPLILLGTLLGLALLGGQFRATDLVKAVLSGIFLVPVAIGSSAFFPLDAPLWSLFYEIWANVLYAAIIRSRAAVVGCAASGAAILLLIVGRGHNISGGYTTSTIPLGVGQIFWGFFAGVILSWLLTDDRVKRLPSVPFPVLAALLAAMLFNLTTWPWYSALCVLILFPALVVLGVKDLAAGSTRKAALTAGALSYPLYVVHYPIVERLRAFKAHPASAAIMGLCLVLVVSYAAWTWYDEPVRAWLGRAARRRWLRLLGLTD